MTTASKKVNPQLTFKGEYNATVTYKPLDVVTWHNSLYICGVSVTGIAPDKYSGSSSSQYGSSYWYQALPAFYPYDYSDSTNGYSELKTMIVAGHVKYIHTRQTTPTQPAIWEYCNDMY